MPAALRSRERTTPRTLTAERILDGSGGATASPAWITVADGRIVAVGTGTPPGPAAGHVPGLLAPALVDIQVNGHGDCDFATSPTDAIVAAADDLAARGVGAILVTICSAPLTEYPAILARVAAARAARPGIIVGVHLEGPFLGGAPGAHPPEVVRSVDPAFVDAICRDHADLVRLVTLAPEADPGHDAIRAFTGVGIRVALGHTTAGSAESLAAVGAGATLATHLFNGMTPLHHREPGLVGVALTDARIVPTLISDLVHVHPTVVGLALAARPDAVVVSDAVRRGAERLPDGTLAGSAIDLSGALTRILALGLPPARAVRHVTGNPAHALGLPDRGRLVPGARADLVAIDPLTAAVSPVHPG